MSKPRVALIGLGLMGSGMARRLLGAGFPLSVYNRNPERAAPLAAEGAHVAASPREAAARADVIVAMVADDAASRSVWLGKDGALAGAARGGRARRVQHAHRRLDRGAVARGGRGRLPSCSTRR